jgi:hypothetical protein
VRNWRASGRLDLDREVAEAALSAAMARAAARQLRAGRDNPPMTDELDLPRDPDYDDVPEELAEQEGRRVRLWIDGQPPLEGTLVIVPQTWAHGRRLGEDPPPLGPGMN